ncbi:hypothetical protein D3C72_2567560 [compost metagenome]
MVALSAIPATLLSLLTPLPKKAMAKARTLVLGLMLVKVTVRVAEPAASLPEMLK